VCAECHRFEAQTFGRGKHGARGTVGLPPLRVEAARKPMHASAAQAELGCSSCHDPHALDLARAASDACLSCHDDAHSRAFAGSKHAGTQVTCATCHLPRVEISDAAKGARVAVNHNNSFTLQPRDRMLRMVCLDCHSVELSLSAVYDETCVRENFSRAPMRSHQTLEMTPSAQQN
jgi:hypothetical protein